MLVLSRKEAQRIRLGDSIVISVLRIGGDKVRIGIEAPKDMLVLRDELEKFEIPAAAGVASDLESAEQSGSRSGNYERRLLSRTA